MTGRKICGGGTHKRAETAGAGQVIGEGAESGQQQTGRLFVGITILSDVTERKKFTCWAVNQKKKPLNLVGTATT